MPIHYPNQCWLIVNWALRNKIRWNSNQNTQISIDENAFENVFCQTTTILSRRRWANLTGYQPNGLAAPTLERQTFKIFELHITLTCCAIYSFPTSSTATNISSFQVYAIAPIYTRRTQTFVNIWKHDYQWYTCTAIWLIFLSLFTHRINIHHIIFWLNCYWKRAFFFNSMFIWQLMNLATKIFKHYIVS